MIEIVAVILIGLWILGYITIPWLNIQEMELFTLNGHMVSVWNVLVFLVYLWFVDLLPTPFREVAAILLLIYSLSWLEIIAVAGFSNLVVIGLIAGTVIYAIRGKYL